MKKRIEINIPNRVFYSLIILLTFAFVGMGVYAYGTSSPSVLGHTFSEIAAPSGCSSGQYIKYSSGLWICETPTSSGVSTPVTCVGTNKGLQWTGSSWTCATYSSTSTTTCSWTGWSETCATGYTEETWPQEISLGCYTLVKQYCSGGTITISNKVSCCPTQLPA